MDRPKLIWLTALAAVAATPDVVVGQVGSLHPQLTDVRLWVSSPAATVAESNVAQSPEATSHSFFGTTGAAGLGGLVGGLAGLYLGEAATQLDEDLEDVFMVNGAILGSWFGGWYGARTMSQRSGPAALGSALGVVAGALAFDRLDGGYGGVVAYAVTHGLVTALIAAARR